MQTMPPPESFTTSQSYWEERYSHGGTSGAGSYGRLALFKAEVLNEFVLRNDVRTVVEFGCGDGHQLSLAAYPAYVGLDVSRQSIQLCLERFRADPAKSFFLYDPFCFEDRHGLLCSDLALSLDVIYHLVEDDVYELYMSHLFRASRRFVIVYSSNFDSDAGSPPHVRHRRFADWVARRRPEWALAGSIPNVYPYNPARPRDTSLANFYVYLKP